MSVALIAHRADWVRAVVGCLFLAGLSTAVRQNVFMRVQNDVIERSHTSVVAYRFHFGKLFITAHAPAHGVLSASYAFGRAIEDEFSPVLFSRVDCRFLLFMSRFTLKRGRGVFAVCLALRAKAIQR